MTDDEKHKLENELLPFAETLSKYLKQLTAKDIIVNAFAVALGAVALYVFLWIGLALAVVWEGY